MNKEQNISTLLDGPVFPSLLKLAIPIMLANMLQASYQLIDAFWVGRLGGPAVAAVSISTPFIFLTTAFGSGLAVSGSIMIAQYYGSRNQQMINKVAAQTLLIVAVLSVILAITGYLFAPILLRAMHVTPEVFKGALRFLRISFVGVVFNFVFMVFQSLMRGVGRVTMPVFIVLGTVVLNFLLDPLFIFGWKFIPPLGVGGAAMATVGTQSLALLIGMRLLFAGTYDIHLQIRDFVPDITHIKVALKIGLPYSIEQSVRGTGAISITFLIARFGTTNMAAYGAGANLIQVAVIPALGLSAAISTLVGQNIGAGNITRASKIAKLGGIAGFTLLTVFGVIGFVFAKKLIGFFVPADPAIINTGAAFLHAVCFSWGFLGLQLCIAAVLRSTGDTFISMLLTLISLWVLQFPIAYLLSTYTILAIQGIWLAYSISTILTAAITVAVFAKGDWKKQLFTNTTIGKATEAK